MPEPGVEVLVVDDDVAVLASLKFALEVEGFRVHPYRSAEDLLDAAMPAGPDCLVIDLRLPGLDGLALAAALRARGVACPAILMTTNPAQKVQAAAAEAGLTIVEKPLLGNTLAEAIRAMLAAPAGRS
jgi:two-component system response regulator FixJ